MLRRTVLLLGLSVFAVFFSQVMGVAGAGGLCTLVLAFIAALGWKAEKVTAAPPSDAALLNLRSALLAPQVPVAALVGRVWDLFQPLLFGLIGAEILLEKIKAATVGKKLLLLLLPGNRLSARL